MKPEVKSVKVKSRRRINCLSNIFKILGVACLVQNVHSLNWLGSGGGVNTVEPLIRAGYSSSLVILLSLNGYHAAGISGQTPESVPQPELHTQLVKSNRSPRKLQLVTSTLRTMGCLPKFFCGMDVKDTRWSDLAYLIKFAMKHPVTRRSKANEKKKNGPNGVGNKKGVIAGVIDKIVGIGKSPAVSNNPGQISGNFVGPPGGIANNGDDSEEHQSNSENDQSEEESDSKHDEDDDTSSEIHADEESQHLNDTTLSVPIIGTKSKQNGKPTNINKYKDEEALVDELLSKLEIAMEATKTKDDTQLETILADLKQIMFRSGRSQDNNSTSGARRGRGAFWEEFHFQKEMTLAANIRHRDLASQKLDEICTSTFVHCPYTVSEMRYMTQSARAEEFRARSEFESLFPKPPPLTPPPPTTPYPKPPSLTPTPLPSSKSTSIDVRAHSIGDISASEESGEDHSQIISTFSNQTEVETSGNSLTTLFKSILPISLNTDNEINAEDEKSRSLLITPTASTSSTTQVMSSAKNYGMSILNSAKPSLRNFIHKSAAYLGLSKPEEDVKVGDDVDDETGFDSISHKDGGDYNDYKELWLSSLSQGLSDSVDDFTTRKSKALPKSDADSHMERTGSSSKVSRRALALDEPEEDEESWEGHELKKTSSSEEHHPPPQPDRDHNRHVVPPRDHEKEQDDHDREMEREDDDLLEQEEQARTSEEMSDERDFSSGPPYPPGPPHPPPGQPPPPRPSSVLGHDFKKVEAQWGSVEREPSESSEEEEPKKKTKKKRKKQKESQDLGPPPPSIRPTTRPTTTTTTTTPAPPVTNSPPKSHRDPNLSPLKKWEKTRLGSPQEVPQTTQKSIMEVLFGTRSTTSKPDDNGLFKKKRKSPFHLLIKNALTSEKVTNFLGQKVDLPMYEEEEDANSSDGGHHLDSEESLWSPPPSKTNKRKQRPRPASSGYDHLWQDQHTNSPQATWSNSQEVPLVFSNPQSDMGGYNPMPLSNFDQSPTFGYHQYQQQQSQYPHQFSQGSSSSQYQGPQPPPGPPPVDYQQQYSIQQPQQEGSHAGPPPFPYFRAITIESDNMFSDPISPEARELQKSTTLKKVSTIGASPTRQRVKIRPQATSAAATPKTPSSVQSPVPKRKIPQRNPNRTPTTATTIRPSTTPLPRQRTRTRGTPKTTEKMESYGYTTKQDKRRTNGASSYKQITSWEEPTYDDKDLGHFISWEIPASHEAASLEPDTFSKFSELNQPQAHFKQQIRRSASIHNYNSGELMTRSRSHQSASIPRKSGVATSSLIQKQANAQVLRSKPTTRPVSLARSFYQQRYPEFSQKAGVSTATVAFRNQCQKKSPSATVSYTQKPKHHSEQRSISLSGVPYSFGINSGHKSQPTSPKRVITRTPSQKIQNRSNNSRLPIPRQILTTRKQRVRTDARSDVVDDHYGQGHHHDNSPLKIQQQQTLQLFLAQQLKSLAEQQLKIAQQMPLLSSKRSKSNIN